LDLFRSKELWVQELLERLSWFIKTKKKQ